MAWLDIVLNRMFFTRPEEGERLAGLPFMIAATAGMAKDTYTPEGRNLYPLEDLLRPWQVTAKQSRFAWHPPFLAYDTDNYTDQDRRKVAQDFAQRIREWSAVAHRD
jgi:putative NADPH-quinone reductase